MTTQFAVHAVRTAADGSPLWEKTYTFGSGIAPGASLELLDGSGFALAGSLITGQDDDSDIFLMKVDCAGMPVWAYSYPGPSGLTNGVNNLIETANGDIVMAGHSQDNNSTTLDALLLRADASGALLWSRKYDAGDFTSFQGVAEVRGGHDGDGDLVVVGFRQVSTDPHRPIVLRLGPNGRVGGPRGCALQYEAATVAIFSAVTALTTERHVGDFLLAGRIEGSGTLFVRTGADVCQPVVERIIEADTTATTAIAEVPVSLRGVPRGTLAVAGTVRVNPQAPTDGYLLTLSPSTLTPRSAHLMGDHSAQASTNSHFTTVRSVLPLADGFAVTGDSTIGPIFDDDMDLYVVKTDAQGQTPCDAPWEPAHRRAHIRTAPMKLPSASAGLGSVPQSNIAVEDQDATRDACE